MSDNNGFVGETFKQYKPKELNMRQGHKQMVKYD